MARRSRAALAAAACLALAATISCDGTGGAVQVPWSSKVVEFHPYGEAGESAWDPEFTIVYGPDGLPDGRFEMAYDAEGKPTRTDLYQYDEAGAQRSHMGYYLYTYDGSGRLIRGDACSPDDTIGEYYVVTYDGFGNYTSIIDWTATDTGFKRTYSHYVSWADPAEGRYRLERYYKFDEAGAAETLQREYQAYYDSAGRLMNEIYHVVRSTDGSVSGDILPSGSNEGYFYVQFSDNDQGLTFLQSDNWYGDPLDPAGLPTDLGTNRPAFNPAVLYPVNPSFIGNNADILMTEYNADGNWVKDSFYMYGMLQEVVSYSWLDAWRISETSRYVNGGKTLDQRDSVRYKDAVVEGRSYATVETTTWYVGSDPADNLDASQAPARRGNLAARRGSAAERAALNPSGSTPAELLSAWGGIIFRQLGDRHEKH